MAPPDLLPPTGWDDLQVVHDHPELHHYTDLRGLEGIVGTGTLWATHFRDLNDTSEFMAIRAPFEQELAAEFQDLIQQERRHRFKVDRLLGKLGGVQKVATDSAKQMIALLYASTYTDEPGYRGVEDLKGPAFITSFCTHTGQDYERNSGLLSQWRGYGGRGGFCIVFDSMELLHVLARENLTHAYMRMGINEVTYLYPETSVFSVVPKLREACRSFFKRLLDNRRRGSVAVDMFTDFTRAATFSKHHAFHEEREVRIVVQPASEGWRETHGRETTSPVPPSKPIVSNGRSRVVLFEGLGEKLPFRRVIVGPSIDQESNLQFARSLLGPDVPVVLSNTPYVDRAGLPRP